MNTSKCPDRLRIGIAANLCMCERESMFVLSYIC